MTIQNYLNTFGDFNNNIVSLLFDLTNNEILSGRMSILFAYRHAIRPSTPLHDSRKKKQQQLVYCHTHTHTYDESEAHYVVVSRGGVFAVIWEN